jgi:phosphoribosylformylglycinamidine synthase
VFSSAHDLSDGGLVQALAESCLRNGHGVEIALPADSDPFVMLFSETSGRVLVSVPPEAEDDLIALCNESGIHRHRLGTVQDSEDAELRITDQFAVPLTEVRAAWQATIPEAMAAH